jgi:hypothetical protein
MISILAELGLVTVGDEPAWAVASADDRYRYLLGRMWHPAKPQWLWMMLNPSDARANDDPTIRKVAGFTMRRGGGGFVVVNLLAYSDSRPRVVEQALAAGIDVVGEHNGRAIEWALDLVRTNRQLPRPIVAAWGRLPERLDKVTTAIRARVLDLNPLCLGRNRDGSPKHPARLSYDTRFVTWDAAIVP